jgi:hypothetical protein
MKDVKIKLESLQNYQLSVIISKSLCNDKQAFMERFNLTTILLYSTYLMVAAVK